MLQSLAVTFPTSEKMGDRVMIFFLTISLKIDFYVYKFIKLQQTFGEKAAFAEFICFGKDFYACGGQLYTLSYFIFS